MAATDGDLIPVVDYVRASVDKAKDEHTINDQRALNEQTAARLGCRIVARFADNDKSAAKADLVRDDFERMLKVVRAGKLSDGTPVRGVIVVADDRLVRKAGDYERFVDAITYQDGRVYADARGFKDLYDENVENMGLMGAVISRGEVKKMRRRVRRWHRARAERGLPPAGGRAFGWKADRVTIEPAEAELIRTAVSQIIAGRSLNSVTLEWREKGVLTPRGNLWTAKVLNKTFGNPRLCGWRMINGELVRDADGQPVVGQWEPILTTDEWLAIHAIWEARKGHHVSRSGQPTTPLPVDHREHKYLLSGTLRCGRILPDGTMCNTRLRVVRQGHIFRYYCRSKALGGCGGISRRADLLDEFISEAVLAKLEERSAKTKKDAPPWLGQRELNEKEEQLRELRVRFAQRSISNTLFFQEVERLEPEIAALRADRERHVLATQRAQTDMSDIRRRWYSETDDDRLDMSQKRAYIRAALHAVIVHPAGKGQKFNPDLLEPIWREE